jgi:hypothetical protein
VGNADNLNEFCHELTSGWELTGPSYIGLPLALSRLAGYPNPFLIISGIVSLGFAIDRNRHMARRT